MILDGSSNGHVPPNGARRPRAALSGCGEDTTAGRQTRKPSSVVSHRPRREAPQRFFGRRGHSLALSSVRISPFKALLSFSPAKRE
ncbi:hypothetical protein J6590_046890 [Homalodisca vitripennis]|nr:hypothetical protein J6590_046890 [Homalodisca vitripennis]